MVEVMMAVVILSLSVLMIYQSNLLSMNVYSEYANRLGIQSWAEQKIWEAKEKILQTEVPETGQSAGELNYQNRDYRWQLEVQSGESEDFYTIQLDIKWAEGRKTASLSRVSFAQKVKP